MLESTENFETIELDLNNELDPFLLISPTALFII